jgi:DNA-binding winged helix-turn-helix (wHTH) protein/Tol biopolymer transport system component
MLHSHRNLLEPRPSDRLRIGERIVDIPLREIASAEGGEPMRVTLKSLGVLLVLVAHAGRPVSREALLEWVWPDTLPTDDVVTQAITQLRKALGDDREHPRYIETLSKQGYRLIAPVAWVVEAVEPATPIATPGAAPALAPAETPAALAPMAVPAADRSRRRRRRVLLGVAAGIAVVSFALAVRPDRPPRAASRATSPTVPTTGAPLAFQRIASLPVAEERPSLSPDGALLVYTRHGDGDAGASLMLQTSSATPPRTLTESAPDRFDVLPSWSPDGRQIAFVRSDRERCLIMAVPAAGGSARELGECLGGEPHPVSWYPDGRALIAARSAGYSRSSSLEKALYRMPLDSGRWERIPYARSRSNEDMTPAVSPDGRWIAFQRNVSLADLWRVPVEGGTPQRLTHLRTNIYGLAWAPDSRHLLFSRYIDGRTVLSALDVETGRIVDHPGGDNGVMYPSVSGVANSIAFEVEESRSITRRVSLADGEQAIKRSQVIFDSSGSNLLPSVAPDGREVLFVSDRTGDMRLWWQALDRPDSLRSFEGFVPVPRHPALWRADGRYALTIGRVGDAAPGVYEIDPRRGRLVRLPVPDAQPVHVSYHPDPDRLLVVADQGEGLLGVTLYDRSRTPWRALARVADVAVAVVDPRHRRIVMASMSSPEIRSADLDLGGVTTVDRVASQRRNRTLVATPEGVRVMDAGECLWRWRLVAVPGATGAAADEHCLGHQGWWLEGLSHDPASGALYLSSQQEMQTDIGLTTLSAVLDDSAADRAANVANR